jgi:hypothetical protein
MSTLSIISIAYLIGAMFWAWPSIQDLASELKSDQRSLGGVFEFTAGALIAGIFWPLFAIYKLILLLPEFIEKHIPAP